jgi:hypothetical protein
MELPIATQLNYVPGFNEHMRDAPPKGSFTGTPRKRRQEQAGLFGDHIDV